MKILRKGVIEFLSFCAVLGSIMRFMGGCTSEKQDYFAADVPVKAIALPLAFPTDLIYQPSPDPTVLIGTRKQEPGLFDISGFDQKTAQKLWQLPFVGNVVGQTGQQLVVYDEKTATVHFINPQDGRSTRKISPEPAPLTSPSSLYFGMAFTNDLYITTKPLYQNVVVNGQIDTTWKIGVTAKTWKTNETTWFLPPVKQIVIIEHQPVVSGDQVLIVNPEQKIGEGHSYYPLGNEEFFERTPEFVRRLDPFTQKEIWRINGNFTFAQLWKVGNQLTVLSRHANGAQNTMRIVETANGHLIRQFDLPFFKETALKGAYLTRDQQLFLHFKATNFKEPGTLLYDYWVCYDPQNRKALWRTDFHSESLSSLLPFVGL
jgi:hypothetical protein